ncbi:MAG: hypothetical protein ABEJ23_00630 [Haloarculaceae archaeon]
MLQKLGVVGIVGLILLLAGLALVAYQSLIVAAGLAFVIAGVGLLAKGLLNAVVSSMGFGGMM